MEISRRSAIAGTAAAVLLAHAPAHAKEVAEESLASAFSEDRRSLKATRIHGGTPEDMTITAETLGNSALLQFLNRKATAVAVYSAPPGLAVAPRAISAAAPELLFVVKGTTEITAEHGTVSCGIGALTIIESGTVTEKAGPQGYTAIRVRLTP